MKTVQEFDYIVNKEKEYYHISNNKRTPHKKRIAANAALKFINTIFPY